MNVCPVYQQIGGHAYGSVYPGPVGSIVTPGLYGVNTCEASSVRLSREPNESRKVELLRKVGKADRRIRKCLKAVPWFDALVQPEIIEVTKRSKLASETIPTPERAVEESRLLFQAVVDGVKRARELLDLFERRLSEAKEETAPRLDDRG